MSRTISLHDSGAEYIEIKVDPPGGATTLLLRVGEWTARLDVVAGIVDDGPTAGQRVVEVAAFELPDGHVDGDLMPPSEAGIAAGEPDGDPVAVFMFGGEDSGLE